MEHEGDKNNNFSFCLEKRLRELEIRGRIKTIQTTALLKSARILRRVLQKRLGNLKIRGRIKTIQTTAPLKSARILRRVLQKRLGELEIRGRIKTIQITAFRRRGLALLTPMKNHQKLV